MLIDPLPETITVSGREFLISTNFRTGILMEMLLQDSTISDEEKVRTILDLYFIGTVPDNIVAALESILKFYLCGYDVQPVRRRGVSNETKRDERIYDFDIDAPLIYAAFKSQYNIDLQDVENLHWWKFNALFRGLHSSERIVEIIGYRSMNLGEIKDKEQRKHYASLKHRYALPDGRTVEEKIANAGNVFSGGI